MVFVWLTKRLENLLVPLPIGLIRPFYHLPPKDACTGNCDCRDILIFYHADKIRSKINMKKTMMNCGRPVTLNKDVLPCPRPTRSMYGSCIRVCPGLSLLSNSLWLSRIMLLYLSCNSCCNSLLARITKQSNGSDVWFLVATSLATEKILIATQLATQLHESRCKFNGLKFYWAISYFSVYWEIAKPFV
jgi:hypothetical protein